MCFLFYKDFWGTMLGTNANVIFVLRFFYVWDIKTTFSTTGQGKKDKTQRKAQKYT